MKPRSSNFQKNLSPREAFDISVIRARASWPTSSWLPTPAAKGSPLPHEGSDRRYQTKQIAA